MSLKHLINAAAKGQKLPILTLVTIIHTLFHAFITVMSAFHGISPLLIYISSSLVAMTFIINTVGYLLFLRLYSHSVQNIFNRELPITLSERVYSMAEHLALLRPLEIIFRYFTRSLRVLPDVIILGEVRCGTTSLCQQLVSLKYQSVQIKPPFCLWAHPELDNKETFFFVGHYLGYVNPLCYRMCFPLKSNLWLFQNVRAIRNLFCCRQSNLSSSFFTFDGCAQYLTSPSAPYLIAEAYRSAKQPPPVMIACVRDPTDQALSWWEYERNAMDWGASMGLKKFNTKLRSDAYPPQTINEALSFSQSVKVQRQYKNAECLFHVNGGGKKYKLPSWAMTWPGGQLSGIGMNAKFASNISRYETTFRNTFGVNEQRGNACVGEEFVNIISMKQISDTDHCKDFLIKVLEQVANRRKKQDQKNFIHDISRLQASDEKLVSIHRNMSSSSSSLSRNRMRNDLSNRTQSFFHEEKEKLKLLPAQILL